MTRARLLPAVRPDLHTVPMNFAPVPDDETVIINGAWLYSGKQIRRYGSGPAIAWASDVAVSPGLDWQLIAD